MFYQKINAMNYEQLNNLYESLCDKYMMLKEQVTDAKKLDELTYISDDMITIQRYLTTSLEVALNTLRKIEKDLNKL